MVRAGQSPAAPHARSAAISCPSMPSLLTLPVGPRDHARGPESAPVTLVEYGDFECPQCAAAYPIVARIIDTFGDRLRFVFRHFPLTNSHPNAQHAAEAAECGGAGQAQFWPMYDALYARAREALRPEDPGVWRRGLGLVERRDRARLGLARRCSAASRKTSRAASRAASPARRRSSSTAPATKAAGTSSRSPTRSKRRCTSRAPRPAPLAGLGDRR